MPERVVGTPRYLTIDDVRAAARGSSGPLFGVPETDDMIACGLDADAIISRQHWGGATPPGERERWESDVRRRTALRARVETAARVYATALVECAADYDLGIHTNPDARAWARFFMRCNPRAAQVLGGDDGDAEGTMIGWFANAMMAMHDHLRGGGPINGDHAQYLIDHPEMAAANATPNTVTVRWGEFDLIGLLRALRALGQMGASRDVVVAPDDEPSKFYFDGDGPARLEFDEPETAASQWWDRLTPRERRAYVMAHPHSDYARAAREAPRMALEHHLLRNGYHARAGAWHHARSGARVMVSGARVHVDMPGQKRRSVPLQNVHHAKRLVRAATRVLPRTPSRRKAWNGF